MWTQISYFPILLIAKIDLLALYVYEETMLLYYEY